MREKVLIYSDTPKSAPELAAAARLLYPNTECEIFALYINLTAPLEPVFDHRVSVNDERIARYDIPNICTCMEELQKQYAFDCVLIHATTWGRMLAPRLAMRLKTGLVADVTDIKSDKNGIALIRPTFGGKLFAEVRVQNATPLMASIRVNVFTGDFLNSLTNKKTDCIEFTLSRFEKPRVTLLETRENHRAADIRESQVLVSGGGGVAHSFEKLEALAEALGGLVSSSRKPVDMGLVPRSIQVGQSGKTVSPDLYIALGIYGAAQHIVGLKNARVIIAVNTNKNVPLCSLADMVVEGDAVCFIDKLLDRIQQNKSR
jgi:electron transfer flavoprotein alpha subunit